MTLRQRVLTVIVIAVPVMAVVVPLWQSSPAAPQQGPTSEAIAQVHAIVKAAGYVVKHDATSGNDTIVVANDCTVAILWHAGQRQFTFRIPRADGYGPSRPIILAGKLNTVGLTQACT
jgi:hypothetical protein